MTKMIALRAFQSIVHGNLEPGQAFDAREGEAVWMAELGLASIADAPQPVAEAAPVETDEDADQKPRSKGRK